VASGILDVDAFDEPNVTEAKQATQAVLERVASDGRFPVRDALAARDGIRAEAPQAVSEALRPRVAQAGEPASWAAALPALLEAGDYFAILAYFRSTSEREARLARLRHAVRAVSGAATTVGIGKARIAGRSWRASSASPWQAAHCR
jgi:transaldolase/glucose-6-phosphate isomerase